MTITEFSNSGGYSYEGALRALWFAGRGDWEKAHEIAQEEDNRNGAWVHAYLHRMESDIGNADYWYRRAGRPTQTGDTRAEWETIVMELLQQQADLLSSRNEL